MIQRKYLGWAAFLAVAAIALPVLAAGILTNGLPLVNNWGTTTTGQATLPLTGSELIPADTQLASGQMPQSEAISVNQLKGFYRAAAALTPGSSVEVDVGAADYFTLDLTANSTLANPANPVVGQVWRVIVQQDGGSKTLGYGSAYYFPGGVKPTLSVTDGAVDILTIIYNGHS